MSWTLYLCGRRQSGPIGKLAIQRAGQGAYLRNRISPHSRAILQALFVTFLWSTSWVLIKLGLVEIPALVFAGLRYGLAFLCLLPFALRPANRAAVRALTLRQWLLLAGYGLLFYALVQGAQFVSLAYLPAATVSLVLNFTSLLVAFLGGLWLAERLGLLAWFGVILSVAGGLIFFYPVLYSPAQSFGLVVAFIGMAANALSALAGRYINHHQRIPALTVTVVSMGIGAAALLTTGILLQGLPRLGWGSWAILAWLAVINTAFAFTLWNHSLRTLSATQSSVINNTMLVQIAILAWVFLGERLDAQKAAGMLLAALGTLLVQLRANKTR